MNKYTAVGTIGMMWGDYRRSFGNSYKQMMAYNNRYLVEPGEYILECDASVSWHSAGRNELVQKSLGDWLFMMDTDHKFAPDHLDRLFHYKNKAKARVISGIYQYKFQPHAPVMNIYMNGQLHPIMDWPDHAEFFEVGTCGGGNLLIDRSVFDDIKKKFKCEPFDIIQGLSEDYSFCHRCKELDIPIFVTPKVQFHHVIETVLSIDDYIKPSELFKVKGQLGEVVG